MQQRRTLFAIKSQFNSSFHFAPFRTLTVEVDFDADSLYSDIPRLPRSKSERKPYPTPMKVLIRRAKKERHSHIKCSKKHLTTDYSFLNWLVDVAHRVYRARESLLFSLSKLVRTVPVQRCRCSTGTASKFTLVMWAMKSGPALVQRVVYKMLPSTHTWRRGVQDVVYFPKSFHLYEYDRVGKPRVGHNERRNIRQIPSIIELCIQAGLDLENYPTRRRTRHVYSIKGRIVDFELGKR